MAATVTKMNKMVNPEVMGDMISAKIEALLKITPYAKVDTTLEGVPGDTKTVPKWDYIGDAEDVAEGAEVALTEMSTSSETFTIKKAMKSVGLTQEAINSGYGDPVGQAEVQLAKAIAGKVDADVFAAALSAKRESGDGATVIKYDGVVDVVDVFGEEDITEKVLFIHPSQMATLRKDANFISADKYNNNVMITGEIGMICQTRIVASNRVPLVKATLSATGATDIASSNLATYQGYVYDPSARKMVTIKAGDKVDIASAPYYLCPCIKMEASSADTEFTETELPAITIFLKKDVQTDAEWKPRTQTYEITTAKYYGVALTNEAKVVLGKFKK